MDINGAFPSTGGTTGRTLVLFDEGASEAGMQAVQEAIGVQVVAATGEESAPAEGGGVLFESLGVAVVDAPPDQVMQAAGRARSSRSSPSGSSTRSRRADPRRPPATGMRRCQQAAAPPRCPWRARSTRAG